jgi:hypothetical protein
MADVQGVVDNIRNFLHSGHQSALEPLRALSQEYGEACQEVNRRLARCEVFLRQGLRAEAIQFAQVEPNLLDALAILDFPERSEWDQVVAHYHLFAPPAFRIDVATALNRAYTQVAPVEELLKRHRLLALSRAPLEERLAVLRQIAQRDPDNPVWNQDVIAHEKSRVQELRAEVEQLRRQPGGVPLARLEALNQEVKGTPWKTPVPEDVANTIGSLFSNVQSSHFQTQAEQTARQLSAAYGQQNEQQARLLAQQWQQLPPEVRLGANELLVRWVTEALQWLEKLDRQQAKQQQHVVEIEELQRALADQKTPVEDLEELYRAVSRRKGGVPAHVESAYRRRVRNVVASRVFRERIILVVCFLLGACALAGFLFFALSR